MTRWVVLVSWGTGADPVEVTSWLEAASAITGGSVSANLPGSVGGADAVWDFRGEDDALSPVRALLGSGCVAASEMLALEPIASGYRSLDGPRVKRTLALTVRAGTPDAQVRLFERSLAAMPEHIPQIRSWSLSRVGPGPSTPRWTHVWEQEYADVDGLRVAYMRSPYHWTGVDRWFDPEMPCWIVDPQLAHLFRWADGPVLVD